MVFSQHKNYLGKAFEIQKAENIMWVVSCKAARWPTQPDSEVVVIITDRKLGNEIMCVVVGIATDRKYNEPNTVGGRYRVGQQGGLRHLVRRQHRVHSLHSGTININSFIFSDLVAD